jgi:MFS family permease
MQKGKKNVYLLGASSFFNDAGSDMLVPLLPLYVNSIGGGTALIGLLGGLRNGISGMSKIIGGWLSDYTGRRKRWVFFGYIISVLMKFILALNGSLFGTVSSMSVERVRKMRDAARDAIIADSVKNRGEGFGLHKTLDTLGAVFGTLLVIFLIWKINLDFKKIMFIAAFIAAFSLIPLLFVKEKVGIKIRRGLFSEMRMLDKRVKRLVLIFGIFALADFGLSMLFVLKAKEISGSVIVPFIMYAVYNIVFASFSLYFGKFSDRVGRRPVLIAGYLLFVLMSIGFIFVSSLAWLTVLFFVYGLVYAITQSNQTAFVSDYAGKFKGGSIGLYYFVVGFVSIIGGLFAGTLWGYSEMIFFVYTALVAIISLVLLWKFKEE